MSVNAQVYRPIRNVGEVSTVDADGPDTAAQPSADVARGTARLGIFLPTSHILPLKEVDAPPLLFGIAGISRSIGLGRHAHVFGLS